MKTKNNAGDYILHGVFYALYGVVKYIPSPTGDILRYLVGKIFLKKLKTWRIAEGVTFQYPYRIEIDENVRIHEYANISGFGGLRIGADTAVAPGVNIITSEHVYEGTDRLIREQGLVAKEVLIGRNCQIGLNAIVLKGVHIGDNAVVGAGSVVINDVPKNAIVAGNPARIIRYRE